VYVLDPAQYVSTAILIILVAVGVHVVMAPTRAPEPSTHVLEVDVQPDKLVLDVAEKI
jgi:hypothetical protein